MKFTGYVLLLILLGVIPLITKFTVWVKQTWSSSKVAKTTNSVILAETPVYDATEDETRKVKHEQTADQCEEQNYCSITNENNDEVFARNAIHFSKPANNLLIEGTIGGQKFSFLIDTGECKRH